MIGLGDVVGHKGGQQRIDRPQQSQHQACLHQFGKMPTEIGHHRTQATIGDRPDARQRLEVQIPQTVVVEQEQ